MFTDAGHEETDHARDDDDEGLLKVLRGAFTFGQHIDRVLQGHGSDSRRSTTHFDPQIRRLSPALGGAG